MTSILTFTCSSSGCYLGLSNVRSRTLHASWPHKVYAKAPNLWSSLTKFSTGWDTWEKSQGLTHWKFGSVQVLTANTTRSNWFANGVNIFRTPSRNSTSVPITVYIVPFILVSFFPNPNSWSLGSIPQTNLHRKPLSYMPHSDGNLGFKIKR